MVSVERLGIYMAKKFITEARDTGRNGFWLNNFLVEFKLASDVEAANQLIRSGAVDIDNRKIKDIQFFLDVGSYGVKIHGNFVLEATVL